MQARSTLSKPFCFLLGRTQSKLVRIRSYFFSRIRCSTDKQDEPLSITNHAHSAYRMSLLDFDLEMLLETQQPTFSPCRELKLVAGLFLRSSLPQSSACTYAECVDLLLRRKVPPCHSSFFFSSPFPATAPLPPTPQPPRLGEVSLDRLEGPSRSLLLRPPAPKPAPM